MVKVHTPEKFLFIHMLVVCLCFSVSLCVSLFVMGDLHDLRKTKIDVVCCLQSFASQWHFA